jgi:hypothetical protein
MEEEEGSDPTKVLGRDQVGSSATPHIPFSIPVPMVAEFDD